MPQIWDTPPNFVQGQVLSAGSHLNALCYNVQTLFDDVSGPQMPFSGLSTHYDVGSEWTVQWSGWVRHKYPNFEYKIEVQDGGSVSIYYDGHDITGALGNGTHSASVSLAGLGLTLNQFYNIYVSMSYPTKVTVWRMAEAISPSTGPIFASFANETVPSAANFQALSDYSTSLATTLNRPYPPCVRTNVMWRGAQRQWVGSIKHMGRYLSYSFWQGRPGSKDDGGGNPWSTVDLKINGVTAASFCLVKGSSAPPTGVVDQDQDGITVRVEYTHDSSKGFTGTLDLSKYGPELISTNDYTLEAVYYDNGEGGGWGFKAFWFWEVPDASPTFFAFETLPTWVHGDYVYGDSIPGRDNNPYVPTLVQTIKNDLAVLSLANVQYNYPCITSRINLDWRFSAMRRWRFLHYKAHNWGTAEAPDYGAKIAYVVDDEMHEVSLPDNEGVWSVHDLEGDQYAYPGTVYLLAGVEAAVEDVVP